MRRGDQTNETQAAPASQAAASAPYAACETASAAEAAACETAAALRYAEAVRPGVKADVVLRSDPVIRVRPGMNARLSTATVRDVFDAIRNLSREPIPAAYVKRVQRATRGISQRLENLDIHTATARSVQRRSGRLAVRIEVDGDEAELLLAVLGRA